jgi:transposase InsO family protein
MPWLETDVRDQRIRFVLAAREGTVTMTTLCEAFGISRKTGYKWLAREKAAGSVAALADRSRRPQHSPQRTGAALTAQVVAARTKYGWGGAKLAAVLAAGGTRVAARTIDRIIAREGLTRSDTSPAPARRRFEADAPNDLWQLDAKGHYPLAGGARCHPLSVLDDHSRFAVGLAALASLHEPGVRQVLCACFEQYGVPQRMLMDHGSPWWATSNAAGLSRLSVWLVKQGITLRHGRVRHPQTQGKVERFHRTLGERLRWWGVPTDLSGFEIALAAFREEYNTVRPHAALGQQPPRTRYTASPRAYRPEPPRWVYPEGSEVVRIDGHGMLSYRAQRIYVSEALIGEDVALQPIGLRRLVVYRHMFVREFSLRTGRSRSLLEPADVLPMS